MAYTVTFSVRNWGADMQASIQRLLRSASLLAEREARIGALEFKDTGALARSITSEIQGTTVRVYSPLAYATPVDEGRRPGAKMPPPAALEPWMRRHGMDPRMSFVLARAISRRGIPGRFFFRRAVQALQREMPNLVRQALRGRG